VNCNVVLRSVHVEVRKLNVLYSNALYLLITSSRYGAVTAISLTSFAVTEFLLKLDCQRGIHPKLLE
jgi:hypothetical protein